MELDRLENWVMLYGIWYINESHYYNNIMEWWMSRSTGDMWRWACYGNDVICMNAEGAMNVFWAETVVWDF